MCIRDSFRTCHSQDLYTFMGSWQPDYRGFSICVVPVHRWTWLSIRSRWDLFFIYIYFYGIGGTRRGKHHALRHTRSTFYYLFLSWWLNSDLLSHLRQRLTLKRVSRVGSPSCSTAVQGYILWDWKLKHDVNNKFIIWLSTCLLLQRTKTWEKQLTSAG